MSWAKKLCTPIDLPQDEGRIAWLNLESYVEIARNEEWRLIKDEPLSEREYLVLVDRFV